MLKGNDSNIDIVINILLKQVCAWLFEEWEF